MKRTLQLLAGVALYAVWVATAACSSDTATETSGARVTLKTRVVANGVDAFTNDYGWTVNLSRALVSTGPLYYFEGAPLEASWWGIRPAYAHPGHYQAGQTDGEMLTEWSVDLLAGPASLADGNAVTGTVRSATFSFNPPTAGPVKDQLDGHVVLLEGMAQKDDDSRLFRAVADEAELLNAEGKPLVEGCPFESGAIGNSGTVTLTIDVPLWLDQVDFEQLVPSTNGEPVSFEPDSIVDKAFLRGLKKAAAYHFSYGAS
ncbi:MAG: hypothetical protein KC776_34775 [Myxococcales bacterium]|nr:hypothetical protein [Myxococcales bacterium]MCB9581919.1 hypothetical protein [Polyangiaceae bacterium]